jgi:hypothetical protein
MIDYSKLDYLELLQICKKRQIKGYGHQKKKRIITLLEQYDKETEDMINTLKKEIYSKLGIVGVLYLNMSKSYLTNCILIQHYFRKEKLKSSQQD